MRTKPPSAQSQEMTAVSPKQTCQIHTSGGKPTFAAVCAKVSDADKIDFDVLGLNACYARITIAAEGSTGRTGHSLQLRAIRTASR